MQSSATEQYYEEEEDEEGPRQTPFLKPLVPTMIHKTTRVYHPHLLDSQEILDQAARQRRLAQAGADSRDLADQLAKVNAEAARLQRTIQGWESSQDQRLLADNDDEEEVVESPLTSQHSYPRGWGGGGGHGSGGASAASSGY